MEQVKAGLEAGTLSPSDLAWHEGRVDWTAIDKLLASLAAPPPPPPSSQPPPPSGAAATAATHAQIAPLPPPANTYMPVGHRLSEALKSAGRTQQIALGVCLLLIVVIVGFNIRGRISIFGPNNAQIEAGITYSLRQHIRGDGPLFSSYKITNKYTRRVKGEKWFIYELSAICGVNEFGQNKIKEFSVTTALTKRGSEWSYRTQDPQ